MHEVVLSKIKVDELHEEQVIFLKEKEGARVMPVVIGLSEVNAIKIKLSGLVISRPLTHDLLQSVIESLGGRVEKVVIDRIEANTFFAKILIRKANKELVEVDARPSDSVALALRANAPIFVADEVLNVAGIPPVY